MYVICGGMPRSCSTWQYNVAAHLVERSRAGRRIGFLPRGADFVAHELSEPDSTSWRVFKTHGADPTFSDALANGRALGLYSYRDLRDVAFSLAHQLGQTFEEEVERN